MRVVGAKPAPAVRSFFTGVYKTMTARGFANLADTPGCGFRTSPAPGVSAVAPWRYDDAQDQQAR